MAGLLVGWLMDVDVVVLIQSLEYLLFYHDQLWIGLIIATEGSQVIIIS